MIRLIKWLFILFFLFGVLMGILTVNSIEKSAIVVQPAELSSAEIKRVKRFIQLNNPANMKSGEVANSEISQQDLNLALNYISQRAPGPLRRRVHSKVIIDDQLAYIQASIRLPNNPAGKYINITTDLQTIDSEKQKIVKVDSLSIGSMSIPSFVAAYLANYVHKELKQAVPEYKLVSQSVQNIKFDKNKLTVNYVWDKETANSIKTSLSSRVISKELKQALIAQYNKLAQLSYQLPARPGLNKLLKPMFKLAKKRSENNNPVVENKAVFMTLGAYALNRNIPRFLGEEYEKTAKHKNIYLKGRRDLSKHAMISAAITSMADSSMAETIGLEKEIKDSQGGSGFSFSDLAADHAGIRLAEQAIASEQQARNMQNKLSMINLESDYMLDIENLPDGIQQREFAMDYSSTNSVAYKQLENLIKGRIDKLAIYQN